MFDVLNLQPARLMTSANQSQIDRLRREIAGLNQDDSREGRKEADLLGKLNRAQEGAAARGPTGGKQLQI